MSSSAPEGPAPKDLISEFRSKIKDKGRGMLLEAYLRKPSSDAISAKALELLAEEIDAIDRT